MSTSRKWLFIISGIILFCSVIIFILCYAHFQSQIPSLKLQERVELENATRSSLIQNLTTIAQIIGAVLLAIGAYSTWRSMKATEQNVMIAQEGQISSRLTQAVELLGSEKTEVCLGGIYALERIARESEKDHRMIMEILTAYVRLKSPWIEDAVERRKALSPPEDIQAVLIVLGRRKWRNKENLPLDLYKTDLRGLRLIEADLSGIDFRESHLENANLSRTIWDEHCIKGQFFQGAHIEGATLSHAKGLTEDVINSASPNDHTLLPDVHLWKGYT